MITFEEAKQLKPGDILVHDTGSRWKVNGKVRTWKRDSTRIYIPLKHGLYSYGCLDEVDFPNGECNQMTKEV